MNAVMKVSNSGRIHYMLVRNKPTPRSKLDLVDRSSREFKLQRCLKKETLSIEEIELLLRTGTNPNYRNALGDTALHIAVFKRRYDVVELLLKYNATVDAQNADGNTPLHIAAMNYIFNESEPIIDALLQHKASLENLNNKRETPLSIAVQKCSPELMEMLLQRGANVLAPNEDGIIPMYTVLSNCNVIVIEILKQMEAIPLPQTTILGILHTLKMDEDIKERARKLFLRGISISCLLSCARILVKYTLFKSIKSYEIWNRSQKGDLLMDIWDYMRQCLVVARCMRSKRMQGHISLFQFLTYGIAYGPIDYEFYSHIAINYMLYKTEQSSFVLYHDIVAARVYKKALVDRLTDYMVYTKSQCGQNIIVLNCASVRSLTNFLPNIDILNLIIVFSQNIIF